VQSGEVKHGVVPFENSTYGPVVATFDLLASSLRTNEQHDPAATAPLKSFSNIFATRDIFVQVRHCLLARDVGTNGTTSTTANESSPFSHIQKVQSHEQALGQCRKYLATHLKHAEKKEVTSTSKAAELAAADSTGQTAAICSEMAAELYGLKVLHRSIQDREDNVTRFLVLQRADACEVSPTNGAVTEDSYKALVIFTTMSHTSPGALADSLAAFKLHDVNLTSINTRPSGLAPWNYYFFVEVTAQSGGHGPDSGLTGKGKIDAALADLARVAENSKRLGGWTC